jgi:hypothetical protein
MKVVVVVMFMMIIIIITIFSQGAHSQKYIV